MLSVVTIPLVSIYNTTQNIGSNNETDTQDVSSASDLNSNDISYKGSSVNEPPHKKSYVHESYTQVKMTNTKKVCVLKFLLFSHTKFIFVC